MAVADGEPEDDDDPSGNGNNPSLPPGCPPPYLCVFGYRWLLFRIMLGAGLIKLRGDQCWRDLTCMVR